MATTRIVAFGGEFGCGGGDFLAVVPAADVHAKPNLARTRSLASCSAVADLSRNSATV